MGVRHLPESLLPPQLIVGFVLLVLQLKKKTPTDIKSTNFTIKHPSLNYWDYLKSRTGQLTV
jgi:hypothetical protein